MPDKKLNKIKTGLFSRGLRIAKLTLDTGASLAGTKLKSSTASADEKDGIWKNFLVQRAGAISAELGQLKGSLLKAGQMLSMYGEHFLPPEANEFLKSLQSQSHSLEYSEIEKVLIQELGHEKLATLQIEKDPIGAASLGQVHRAKILSTGEYVALKVQYPGVAGAIDSDLRALKSIFSLGQILPKGERTDQMFAEVRTMLQQELDYEIEKKETQAYSKRLENDDRFVVPKVYEQYCTSKVMTTSFERGLPPDDTLIKNLDQNRRNQLGLNYLDLYFKELFEWGVVQTDPHLGNYRIRLSPDGRDKLVLFDFGAVRYYPQAFLLPYRRMVKAAVQGEREALHEAALELKFLEVEDSPELKKIFEDFCMDFVEPFLHETYDWKNSDLPSRLTKKVMHIIANFPRRTPPREVVFLDRKTGGVFIFLSVLLAKVNGRELIDPYLDKVT